MGFATRVGGTLVARGLGLAVGVTSSIVTARWLGAEGRGILATLAALTGLVLQIGNLGLHSSNVYFMAREPGRARVILANALWTSVAMGIAGAVVCLGVFHGWPEILGAVPLALLLVTCVALPFQFLILFFQNALLGLGRVRAFNVFELVHRGGVFVFLAVYLIGASGGAAGAVVLFAVGAAVFGLASVAYTARLVGIGRPDRALLGSMLGYGGRAWVACLLTFLIARVQVFLINAHDWVAATGVYSIALQIADTMLLVPGTIGMILMPRIAAASQGDRAAITARVSRLAVLVMTILCGAAAAVAAPAMHILYGPEFAGAVAPFLWLLPGVWATGLSGILMNHFAGDGLPSIVIGAPLGALAVNLALNAWLLPGLGLTGAALAASASALFMLALTMASFLRRGGLPLRQALVPVAGEVAALLEIRP